MAGSSNRLGQLLRERREALGYSRTRAAQLSGVNQATIQAWEYGRTAKPAIHDVVLLARALNITPQELNDAALADAAPHTEDSATVADDERLEPSAPAGADASPVGGPLLARALVGLGWTDHDAATVLGTTVEHIQAAQAGREMLSVSQVVTLTGLLVAFPFDQEKASSADVQDLVARLRPTLA